MEETENIKGKNRKQKLEQRTFFYYYVLIFFLIYVYTCIVVCNASWCITEK